MDLWIWILLAVVIVVLLIVVVTTLRAIRPKAPEPLRTTAVPVRPTTRGGPGTPARATAGPAAPEALAPDVVAQIDALLAAEQKIRAIKVLREATGSSLQEAKTRIDGWAASRAGARPGAVAPSSAVAPAAPHPADAVAHLDPAVRAEIARLVAAGQKIAAIKLLREATGLGLKDSKDAVEAWR